jgi:hypothetical protein
MTDREKADEAIDNAVSGLREHRVDDHEIVAALRRKIDEIEYKNWGDVVGGW